MKDQYIFVVLADIHIGQYDPAEHYAKELSHILNEINNMKNIDTIFIAGDYFHAAYSLESQETKYGLFFIMQIVEICKSHNAKLRIIKGTKSHDNNQLESFNFISELIDYRYIETVTDELLYPNCKVLYVPEEYITDKALEECSLRLCNVGDILIAMYGATIGKLGIAGIKLTTNQACCACSPIFIYNKFLFYFLMASKQSFIEQGEGGAQPNISRIKLVNYLFPLPPLKEQQRIVEKIEELTPHIELYGKAQAELDLLNKNIKEQLKKSVLQYAIEGKLVPQDETEGMAEELLLQIQAEKQKLYEENKLKKKDLEHSIIFKGEDNKYYEKMGKNIICIDEEIPFEIPKNWRWCRLGVLTIFLSRGKSPKYSEIKKYPVFAQKCNLKSGKLSLDAAKFLDERTLSKWRDEYKLRNNDILINSTGTGTVGRVGIFSEQILGNYPFIVPDSHISVVRTFSNIDSYYIYYLMCSSIIQHYIEDNLAGSTNQKELYIGVLEKLLLPLPPLSEQQRIVNAIQNIFRCIEN
mgnify:CR=1 FL=1